MMPERIKNKFRAISDTTINSFIGCSSFLYSAIRSSSSEDRSGQYDQTIAKPYETDKLVEDIPQCVDEIHIISSFLRGGYSSCIYHTISSVR